jgi:hypothetical protein
MAQTLVNCTPHALNVRKADGSVVVIPPSGVVVRVATTTVLICEVNGVAVVGTEYGEIVGLPEEKPNVFLIVSGMVRAASNRRDLMSPGAQTRDEKGVVTGCNGLTI